MVKSIKSNGFPLITVETIEGYDYEILGLVHVVEKAKIFGAGATTKAKEEIIKQAKQLGSNAIIGCRITYPIQNDNFYCSIYGTAVSISKIKNEQES